jgi:hypothetical protein
MGVSMMIMGGQLQEINNRSMEPYLKTLETEQIRQKSIGNAEKWQEFSAVIFAFITFLVPPPSTLTN